MHRKIKSVALGITLGLLIGSGLLWAFKPTLSPHKYNDLGDSLVSHLSP